MNKISAVLFDLDGTLRDTRDLMYTSLQVAFEQHTGKNPSREEINPHIHHHSNVHKALAPEVPFEAFEQTFIEQFELGRGNIQLYGQARELLDALRQQGLRLAIVTAARTTKSNEFIERHKLDTHFEVVSGMQDGVQPKPAPDVVIRALERLGCKPENAIMVGDTTADIAAAHAAGVRCVSITHGFGTREEFEAAGADYIVDTLTEIPALIEQIEAI